MSDILKAVNQTAKGLRKAGVINRITMRKFDALCLTKAHESTAHQARVPRTKNGYKEYNT